METILKNLSLQYSSFVICVYVDEPYLIEFRYNLYAKASVMSSDCRVLSSLTLHPRININYWSRREEWPRNESIIRAAQCQSYADVGNY